MPRPPFQYGGQAVIEGVMMRGPRLLAIAIRRPGGDVLVDVQESKSAAQRFPFLRWPVLRGMLALVESLVIGIRALAFSANQQAESEEEELSSKEIGVAVLLAVGLASLLFIVIPTGLAFLLKGLMTSVWQNLVEGAVRILIFLAYVILISRMRDIQRVFEYHGAEHRVIHTHEAGEELTVANAQRHSNLHPRCGTAFLLIVMLLTILVYSLINANTLLWRVGSRLLLLPAVAGVGYELLKLSSRHQGLWLVRMLITPGLLLQKLTTRAPDDSQVEIAIRALQAVLPADGAGDSQIPA